MKLTKRKQFAFYRSYYDVFNELSDSDKLKFIEALLDKQFLDIDPVDLKGMVKFAYISQMDSIEKQVKGFCDKTKTPLNQNKIYPWQGVEITPTQGGLNTPTEQEKEKEKEKTTTNSVEVDFVKVDLWIKEIGKSQMYLEGLYRLHKLYNGSISELLTNFKEHLKVYPTKHNNISDFKKHFASWLQIKSSNKELAKYQKQTKGQL